jgi:hypothetical protein
LRLSSPHLFDSSRTTSQSGATGGENPFKKETFNLTKQGQLVRHNPALAERLKREAGV